MIQATSQFSKGTCFNYGGYYFVSGTTTTTTTTVRPSTSFSYFTEYPLQTPTTMVANPEGGICYYSSYSCNGTSYNGQCFTGLTYVTCSTCNNIGGYQPNPSSNYCYYYNSSCKYISINGECQTNRLVFSLFSAQIDLCVKLQTYGIIQQTQVWELSTAFYFIL
jgi:hypothetical protein